ncbi:hypothetical protein SLE2022_248620 [Rubroshorea leprosula]
MVCHATHSWTLVGLVGAFLDLALAYFLLWVTTFSFCMMKFFDFFGVFLPCPCTGVLGYQNSNLCWYELLFEWPTRKICAVLIMVCGRFPFELIWLRDREGNSIMKSLTDWRIENGVLESDGGGCSNSSSCLRLQTLVDKGIECDAKGKKIMNQKQKSGIRRRRRAALGYGKSSSALPYNCGEMRSITSASFGPVTEIEDGFPDDNDAQTGTEVGESVCHRFQLYGSCGEDNKLEKDSSSVKRFISNTQEKVEIAANEADRIRMLENSLQEVKAAHDAIFLELEKERSAAATAADEAMAMMVRIQEDRALIEMEARQYQRMIEEKIAYDEEEMHILKEILVRKEKENHLLEKEVEAYRQMNVLRDEDSPPNLHQIRSGGSFDKEEVSEDASLSPNHNTPAWKQNYSSLVGKEIASMNQSVDSNLFTSQRLAQICGASSNQGSFSHCEHSTPKKYVVLEGKTDADAEDECSMLCQRFPTKVIQGHGTEKSVFSGEELEGDGEPRDQPCRKLKNSTPDMEPTIYDVHVIDDQIELQKEESVRESGPLTSASDEKTLLSDSGRDFCFAVRNERLTIDTEMEWLRERLQSVQEQKEKLPCIADREEWVYAQLKLMEEMMNELHESFSC